MKLKQFEIWITDLEPHYGHETGGKRPVVIVETNAVSKKSSTTVIIPLSSNIERVYDFDVILEASKKTGLQTSSKMMFRQIRVIDKKRLKKKIGSLTEQNKTDFKYRIELLFDVKRMFV